MRGARPFLPDLESLGDIREGNQSFALGQGRKHPAGHCRGAGGEYARPLEKLAAAAVLNVVWIHFAHSQSAIFERKPYHIVSALYASGAAAGKPWDVGYTLVRCSERHHR